MRVEYVKPDRDVRAALKLQLMRLQQPEPVLELLRPVLNDFQVTAVDCTVFSVHPDRFVIRATARSRDGQERAYALKAYADDGGERVWAYARCLAPFQRPDRGGPLLPVGYLPADRVLLSPWVNGQLLSEIVDDRKPALLRQAAVLTTDLHRLPLVPEAPTAAGTIIALALARCERMCAQWPEATPLVEPLKATLEEAGASLDPFDPTPVHGDLGGGQFLWTGARLLLLDLDAFGYSDPAYDAGHFLAQLERRCLIDDVPAARTCYWVASFLDTYCAAMPEVSLRNVSFYRGLTLLRKLATIRRVYPASWPTHAERLADRVRAALNGEAIPRR